MSVTNTWLNGFLADQWEQLSILDLFSVLEDNSSSELEFLTALFVLENKTEELIKYNIDLSSVIHEANIIGYQSYKGKDITKASSDFSPKTEYKKWKFTNAIDSGEYQFPKSKPKDIPPTNKQVVAKVKQSKKTSVKNKSDKSTIGMSPSKADEVKILKDKGTPKKFYKVLKKYKTEKPYSIEEPVVKPKSSSIPKSFYKVLKKYKTEKPYSIEEPVVKPKSSSTPKKFYKVLKKYKTEKPYSVNIEKSSDPKIYKRKDSKVTKNTTPLQSNKGQLKHIAKKLADIYKLLPKDSSKIMSLDDPRVGMAAKWAFRHIKSALTPEGVSVLSDKTLKEGTYQYKNYKYFKKISRD